MRGIILAEANLFLDIKLQPDLIVRAMLQVASILGCKLKIEIEQNSIEKQQKHISDIVLFSSK